MSPNDPKTPPPGPVPDDAQKVFDVVTGPNLRPKDNLYQFAVIAGVTVLAALGGALAAWLRGDDLATYVVAGGFIGLLASLFLSGAVIGLIRGKSAFKGR